MGIDSLLLSQQTPSQMDVTKSFIVELKQLLQSKNAIEVIEGIHSLEAQLNKLEERFGGLEVPNLADFYQDLSPLLLQKYWEQRISNLSEEGADRLFMDSIFIAIEEELYIWQEKIN